MIPAAGIVNNQRCSSVLYIIDWTFGREACMIVNG